jgi:hypothetical protein
VLKAGWMVAEMYEAGERVLARAEATAPFDADDPDLVHYRDHFSPRPDCAPTAPTGA